MQEKNLDRVRIAAKLRRALTVYMQVAWVCGKHHTCVIACFIMVDSILIDSLCCYYHACLDSNGVACVK